MRVLHVIPGIPAASGGPTVAIFGMVRALDALGVEAEIATTNAAMSTRGRPADAHPVMEHGVRLRYFDSPVLGKYGFSPSLARWLHRSVGQYDLVHVHGIFAHPTLPAAAAARRSGVPYVVRATGELGAVPLRKSAGLKRLFLASYGWRILNASSAVHVTSAAERDDLTRWGVRAPVITIPLGVESVLDEGLGRRRDLRDRLGLPDGGKAMLVLARMDPIKGFDLLLEALVRLRASRDDFVVMIAGSGAPAFERKLRRWVTARGLDRHVRFLGFLDGPEKLETLIASDLLVLPSYHENFGMAAVEAMAAGVPVVISDQVGVHDVVREYAAGLVTRCDAQELAHALGRLLDDEPGRRRMGENGRRLVRDRFTWPRVGRELLAVYEGMLASAAVGGR